MSHKSNWSKVLLSAYKASNLFFDLQTASIKSAAPNQLEQFWVPPVLSSPLHSVKLFWVAVWQDIHHWGLKVLVEPETRRCLDLSSAHVHTIRNLINLQQTCALVDALCLPNGSICRRHIHPGCCAHTLLSSTDPSSPIHVDNPWFHTSLVDPIFRGGF